MTYKTHPSDGVALVLALAAIVLATILVVGFTTSMRTERQASLSMMRNENAELVAHAAVRHATALLFRNIPQPLPPGQQPTASNWSIAPGCLFVGSSTIPLSSGDPAASDPELNVIDAAGNKMIASGTTSVKAAWVNLVADPSQKADGSVKLSDGSYNRIVGRYAFWMDDENSKINVNTAYGKPPTQTTYFQNVDPTLNSYIYGVPSFFIPIGGSGRPTPDNPYSLGHPGSVGLDSALFVGTGGFNLDRDLLWADRLSRQINSAAEIQNYVSGDPSFYQKNKFWLTNVNGDPEFNAFGKSRIFFNDSTFPANVSIPGWPLPYSAGFTYVSEPSSTTGGFRDSTEPLTFHIDANSSATGDDSSAQNSAVAAVQQIASYLNYKWPGYNHTFVEKWSSTPGTADQQGYREAQQVAWNVFGMAANASNETMNGNWANQIKSTGTTPSLSTFLWNGPQPDLNWPASRILPEIRGPRVSKFTVGFVATQFAKKNDGKTYATDANGASIKGTTKYVVNVRFWPQYTLPLGFQSIEQFNGGSPEPWNPSSDEIYVTHFEATIDDQSGAGPKRIVWSSEASADSSTALWYDSNGRSNLYMFPGYPAVIPPDGLNHGFVASATGFNSASTKCDLSSSDTTGGKSPRVISFVFDAGSGRDCLISNVKLRFVVTAGNGVYGAPIQMSPIRDVDALPGYEPATTTDSGAIIFPSFHLPTTAIGSNTPEYYVSLETLDPRVNQRGTNPTTGISTISDDWYSAPISNAPPYPSTALPAEGTRNIRLTQSTDPKNPSAYPQTGAAGDESKCAWLDTSVYVQKTPATVQRYRWGTTPGDVFNRMPSVGLLSCISTGIQTGIPWRTIKLQPATDDPPDWLLLDLFAVAFNRVNYTGSNKYPDSLPVPITYLNNTAGKVNINTAVFLNTTTYDTTLRSQPLTALFLNAYRPNVSTRSGTVIDLPAASNLSTSIGQYLKSKATHHFDYLGEICQVPGIADTGSTEWEKEALVRELASLITTRSNVFSVWGVAQTVQKNPANTNLANLGTFETKAAGAKADDLITGEKRFHAIVQRYVWPGVDGTLGNGQTDSSGKYNALGTTANLGSTTNAIDVSDPTNTNAFYRGYNPGAAIMKYRVVSLEYLN